MLSCVTGLKYVESVQKGGRNDVNAIENSGCVETVEGKKWRRAYPAKNIFPCCGLIDNDSIGAGGVASSFETEKGNKARFEFGLRDIGLHLRKTLFPSGPES
jgi:hypothetical protein